MKFILLFITTTVFTVSYSQAYQDSKIIIQVSDTANAFEKVKTAMVRNDFIIKDLPERNLISTYTREYNGLYTAVFAIISGNTITLTGRYTLKRVDYFGYNSADKNQKRIIYYKGSKTWQLLSRVASLIGGETSYAE